MSNGRDCVSRAVLSGERENGAVECAFLVSVVVSLPSSSTCLFDPPNNRPSTKKTRGGGGRAGEDCRFRPLRRRQRRRRHTRLGFTITLRSCCQTLSIWYGWRLLVVLLFWYFSNDFFFHSFQSSPSQKALMVFHFWRWRVGSTSSTKTTEAVVFENWIWPSVPVKWTLGR